MIQLSLSQKLTVAGICLSAAIFISDIFTPLGIADGISYIIVVLFTLRIPSRKSTIIAGVSTSFLTISGIFLSPIGESVFIYSSNRLLSILAIWSCAYLILRFKSASAIAAKYQENLNALFINATEGILMVGKDGSIEMANPMAENLFGYHSRELIGKPVSLILPEEVLIAADNCKETESMGMASDQKKFHVSLKMSSYTLNDKNNLILFVSDISDKKHYEEQILRSNEELRLSTRRLMETNKELENFAYISSHDLQEPLRKIQSFGDRLRATEEDRLTEKGKEYLQRIIYASERMQRLINDLLSFSRLTSKAKQFKQVDLNAILTEVLSDLEVSIRQSGAEIIIPEKLPVIEADATQIGQLLQNLISNAIKFRKDDQTPKITISPSKSKTIPGMISISVIDNGIGFDEKYLGKIFAIFQRLESTKYNGSGIGLAICKKIVLRHNGEINARSRPGEGSAFTFSLPFGHSEYKIKDNDLISNEIHYAEL